MRGELAKISENAFLISGSSPLARGTHPFIASGSSQYRFIPACAGNSLFIVFPDSSITVHPRLRGELGSFASSNIAIGGSSPLARGTQLPGEVKNERARFIPACAGNSRCNLCFHINQLVHPRLRGELSLPIRRVINNPRFIPACAGNSLKMVTTLH